MLSSSFIVQSLINGIGVGLIYGLIGIGFSVIYNASGIVNFAQGVFVMLGGMVTHTLLEQYGLPFAIAAPTSIIFVAAVGVLIHLLVVRPMWNRHSTLYAIILATLAAQIIIERLTILWVGDQPRSFDGITAGGPLLIGGLAISLQTFWILGVAVLLIILLSVFYNYTGIGRALRACAQNREAASLLGIRSNQMLTIAFALSAAFGAIAGILITPTQYTAFNVGESFGISGFVAAILGGFGNPVGALIGGLLLGVAQALAVVMLGAAFKSVTALTIMLAVLIVFPRGLLGGRG